MKQRILLWGGILLACLCGLCLLWAAGPLGRPAKIEQAVQQTGNTVLAAESAPVQVSPEQPEEEENYQSPVDFTALQAANPDIYAWLYIPGTEINYPLLQREQEDHYYLDHSYTGQADKNGALFTEHRYNRRDFSDPVTVVYGHHMKSGRMFGNLQATYSSEEALRQYREVVVYLPDQELRYRVFAAVPFSSDHILYYYNFTREASYQSFLDEVYSVRALGASFDPEVRATPEDRLLILSTCLSGNSKKRFLVLAKLI